MKRKNILLVSHCLGVTGAPSSLLRQAKYFLSAGHRVDVWSIGKQLKDRGLLPRYVEAGLSPEFIEDDADFVQRKFTSCGVKYDLIVCNTVCTYKCVDALQCFGIPVIWFIRETAWLDNWYVFKPDFAKIFSEFYNLYAPAEYTARIIRTFNRHVRVVNNSVADQFKGFARRANEVRFGYIGSMLPVKGVDILLMAFRRLQEGHENVYLTLAGEATDQWARPLVEATKDDKSIIWRGVVQGSAKQEFFDSIDILCVPSLDEPSGLTVMEGAMYGKAIITTDKTGANYLVDEDCGRIVKAGNVGQLAQALKRFAEMPSIDLNRAQHHSRERYLQMATSDVERREVLKMLEENLHNLPTARCQSLKNWSNGFCARVFRYVRRQCWLAVLWAHGRGAWAGSH